MQQPEKWKSTVLFIETLRFSIIKKTIRRSNLVIDLDIYYIFSQSTICLICGLQRDINKTAFCLSRQAKSHIKSEKNINKTAEIELFITALHKIGISHFNIKRSLHKNCLICNSRRENPSVLFIETLRFFDKKKFAYWTDFTLQLHKIALQRT